MWAGVEKGCISFLGKWGGFIYTERAQPYSKAIFYKLHSDSCCHKGPLNDSTEKNEKEGSANGRNFNTGTLLRQIQK